MEMDSTPQTSFHHPLHPAPPKLPIKRKNPNPELRLTAKLGPTIHADGDCDSGGYASDEARKPPPFKFHRIWTEADEVRFLRGLLDCSSHGLSFPRDLQLFYARFSRSMSQPYTRCQLSEKLRRLRKKFRVTSSRIARGLDPAKLSPHDRDLFDLSVKLWHPDHASASPFSNSNPIVNDKVKHMHNLVGVEVSFSPTLPLPSDASPSHVGRDVVNNADNDDCGGGSGGRVDDVNAVDVNVDNDGCVGIKTSEMQFDANLGGGGREEEVCGGLGRVAARAIIDVFDQSLKEVRMVLGREGPLYPDRETSSNDYFKHGKSMDFEKRWRELQVAEFDVLARRLRLVLENALQAQ